MAAHTGHEAITPFPVSGMHVLAADEGNAPMPKPDEMLRRPIHSNLVVRARIIPQRRNMSKHLDDRETPSIETGNKLLGRTDGRTDYDTIGSVLPHTED